MSSTFTDWRNDLWSKKYDVDPERVAIAVSKIPGSSAAIKLRELEDAMRQVAAKVRNLPLTAKVKADENALPHSRSLSRWEKRETPPDPQCACLIVAILNLTGVNISLVGLAEDSETDFGRRISISALCSGPLNLRSEDNQELFNLHSVDFRSNEIKEEIKDPETGIPSKVILAFDELTFHLNTCSSEIDRSRDVFDAPDCDEGDLVRSPLRVSFSGFPESSWVVDSKDKKSAINGAITIRGKPLCTLVGRLTPECSLRVLCRPENLTVEPLFDEVDEAKVTPQDYFRNKLIANVVRDELYRDPGYHLLKEQPILDGDHDN